MQISMSSHYSEFTLMGQNRHPNHTNAVLHLNFGDIVYEVPGMVMHYLDDAKALGWKNGWLPSQDFIDHVMHGRYISFNPLRAGRVEVGMPECKAIGFLSWNNPQKEYIVDTHYGQHISASKAQFGEAPDGFIERMRQLIDKAIHHIEYSENPCHHKSVENEFDYAFLPAAPGYGDLQFRSKGAYNALFSNAKLGKLQRLCLQEGFTPYTKEEILAITPCDIAAELQFTMTDQKSVMARIDTTQSYRSLHHPLTKDADFNKKLRDNIGNVFSQLGVRIDKGNFPDVSVSGSAVDQLWRIGAEFSVCKRQPLVEADALLHVLSDKRDRSAAAIVERGKGNAAAALPRKL